MDSCSIRIVILSVSNLSDLSVYGISLKIHNRTSATLGGYGTAVNAVCVGIEAPLASRGGVHCRHEDGSAVGGESERGQCRSRCIPTRYAASAHH